MKTLSINMAVQNGTEVEATMQLTYFGLDSAAVLAIENAILPQTTNITLTTMPEGTYVLEVRGCLDDGNQFQVAFDAGKIQRH